MQASTKSPGSKSSAGSGAGTLGASTAISGRLRDALDVVSVENRGHCAVERDLRGLARCGCDVVNRRLEPVERGEIVAGELEGLGLGLGRRKLPGACDRRVHVSDSHPSVA